MLLSELLNNSGLEYSLFGEDCDITAITTDSREVVAGSLFIAIEGLHTDGHKYLCAAADGGACAAVVSERAIYEGRACKGCSEMTTAVVEDCREAAARLCAAFYGNPQKKMKFIGVTGTNGKTSVSKMIFEILRRSGILCGLIGTAGCFIGDEELDIRSSDPNANMTTPDPEELYKILSLMYARGVEYVIMEVTSHALALSKVAPIGFEIGVFTNLSEDHLDLHGDMENYFAAKKKLFELCRTAVINFDDRYGRRLAAALPCRVYSCTQEGRECDLSASEIHISPRGIEYKLCSHRLRMRIRSSLKGRFNVMNTLEAAAVAAIVGVTANEIKETMANLGTIKGRFEKVKLDMRAEFSVYIDYAHTPDALENLLATARSLSRLGQRVVLLFGCGGDRERAKRAIMGRIATSMADLTVITSDNSRSERPADIINDITSGADGGGIYTVIEDRREAIEYVIKNARRGDIILLAGKGHEEYEIDGRGKRPFSEKDIVRDMVEKYYS